SRASSVMRGLRQRIAFNAEVLPLRPEAECRTACCRWSAPILELGPRMKKPVRWKRQKFSRTVPMLAHLTAVATPIQRTFRRQQLLAPWMVKLDSANSRYVRTRRKNFTFLYL